MQIFTLVGGTYSWAWNVPCLEVRMLNSKEFVPGQIQMQVLLWHLSDKLKYISVFASADLNWLILLKVNNWWGIAALASCY